MTKFNTGNPIGSADPRDLSDNAKNFDEAVNNPSSATWTDRLGNARATLAAQLGYSNKGDYASGIELTKYNDVIRYNGEFYGPAASTTLPYTTTATLPDADSNLVGRGDLVLRQDLASSPSGGNAGSLLVNGVVHSVRSRAAMKAYDVPPGTQFSLEEGGRSGTFVVKSGTPPSDPQEGIYIVLANGNYAERDSVYSVRPEMYGFSGSSTLQQNTDAINAAISSGKPVKLSAGVEYVTKGLSAFSDAFIYCSTGERPTLKLADAENTDLITSTGVLSISGIKIDQNFQNQTNRFKSAIDFTGSEVHLKDCVFINTMFSGLRVRDSETKTITVKGCKFLEMAEHGGVLGEQTAAIAARVSSADCVVDVQDCIVENQTITDPDAAPGGFIFDVVDYALDGYKSLTFINNKSKNIGQRKAGNLIGFIDLYTKAKNINVIGNYAENYRYSPFKFQNCNSITCSNNIVNGNFDASASTAILFQNVRDFNGTVDKFICSSNIVTLTGNTNVGIYVQGDPDGLSSLLVDKIEVSSNVISGSKYGVQASYIPSATFHSNTIEDADFGYYIRDTYPNQKVKYSVSGGKISLCNNGIVGIGNASNPPDIIVSGVVFVDSATDHVNLNNFNSLTITGCDFDGAANRDVKALSSFMAVVVGNNNGTATSNLEINSGTVRDVGNSWI